MDMCPGEGLLGHCVRLTSHIILSISVQLLQGPLLKGAILPPLSCFYAFVKNQLGDVPGGAGVKNPPIDAGDMDLSPGLGRSHMPWSN